MSTFGFSRFKNCNNCTGETKLSNIKEQPTQFEQNSFTREGSTGRIEQDTLLLAAGQVLLGCTPLPVAALVDRTAHSILRTGMLLGRLLRGSHSSRTLRDRNLPEVVEPPAAVSIEDRPAAVATRRTRAGRRNQDRHLLGGILQGLVQEGDTTPAYNYSWEAVARHIQPGEDSLDRDKGKGPRHTDSCYWVVVVDTRTAAAGEEDTRSSRVGDKLLGHMALHSLAAVGTRQRMRYSG